VAARDLAREVSSEAMFNHCERTFAFAAVLGEREGFEFDPEVLYVASALHDLGLTERFDGPGDFERQGAKAAHEFLMGRGWNESKADLVQEAIALHMRVGTEDHERKEVPLVRLGAAADCLGWGLEDIPPGVVRSVEEQYPRAGLKKELLHLMGDQIERKPDSWLALVDANLDWLERIREAPFPE
jgi:hypothetical protein